MTEEKCANCEYYVGDCGRHHKDFEGHINYEIPAEYMYDGYGCLTCFKPSEKYLRRKHEDQAKELAKYPIDVIERALEIAKMEVRQRADCD